MRPFCRKETVHAPTVGSWPRRLKAAWWNNRVPLFTWPLSHLWRNVRQHLCIFELNTSHARRWVRRRWNQENRQVLYVGPTLHLPASCCGDVRHHHKNRRWNFLDLFRRLVARFQDQRESYFLFQSVLGYSLREPVQHFAVIRKLK